MAYEINGETKLICLLGSPVAHSLSPAMHNLSFAEQNLPYVYLAFDTKEEELEETVKGLRALGARGWNLTMPLKNRMPGLCDRLSPVAEIVGAINTVVVEEDGSLSGHTTDGVGFFRSVAEAGVSIQGEKITLFGAGGAASSILVQAAFDGAKEISVFCRKSSRFYERLQEMIERLQDVCKTQIQIFSYDNETIRRELSDSVLLINATNVGMEPHTEDCLIPDASYLPESIAVADCIYHPQETKLLSMAKEKGLLTIPGLPMLLYQGAESFRLWTGEDMPTDLVKRKVDKFFSE